MIYCFLVGLGFTGYTWYQFGVSNFTDVWGLICAFFVVFAGACGGDIVRRTCKPDGVLYSSTLGLIGLRIFWFCGIQIAGAFVAIFVAAIIMELEFSLWIRYVVAILIGIISIGLNGILASEEV